MFVLMPRPWWGPLRHVYSHTYHRTAMLHTLLESPSDLDVHAGIRFWVFEKNSSKLASKSTLYGYVILTQGSIVLRLRANYLPYSKDLHIFGNPKLAWMSIPGSVLLFFFAKIVEIDVTELAIQNNEIWSLRPNSRCFHLLHL